MKLFVAVSLYVALVCDGLRMEFNEDWKNFKNIYNKKYRHALEDLIRRSVWEENVDKILSHNKLFELGMESFSLGLNEYADLTVEEFKQKMNGFIPRLNRNSSAKMHQYNRYAQLAEAVDWRDKNVVTEIKNQGQCGSCWAFSSTGALEAQHALKNGRLVSLSEQQLVDCSAQYGNHGCNGGFMDYAFQYIKNNHGIDTEESYPYEAQVNVCRFQSSSVAATVAGYVDIPKGDENALKDAVATVGPVTVAIDASSQHFLLYQGGVFDLPSCSQDIDHAVLVVGYGTENGKDYWLVKNSWGTSWGVGGYIKMSRNKNNQCAIASWASYPTV